MLHFRLRVKFLILIMGSLVVFLGILSYVVVQRESRLLTQKSIEKQHVLAQAICEDLRQNMREGRPRSTLNLIKSLRGTYGLVRLEVLRKSGVPVSGQKGDRFNIPMLEQAFDTGSEIGYQENGGLPLHTILSPLKNEKECRTCHGKAKNVLGVILISLSMEDTRREIATSARDLTAFLLLLILMIGAGIYAMIRKVIVGPLATLHLGAERIGRGDLSHRISLATGDEMEDLARAFNGMTARLQESYSGLEGKIREGTAEAARSTNLMGGILSSMSSGVALLNMDGAVKLINLAGARILRCRPEDMVGRRLGDTLPGLSAFETAAFIKVDSGPYQEIDLTMPDGATVPIGFSSTYYKGASGAQEGIIVVYQDLTEIKALQAELLDKERFAAMGRVVAGVAHEIRNPLFGISSIGQIFERELTNPVHLELVTALLAETRRLNQLVEELLIYGRPMKLRLEPCDLGRLWDEVLEMHAGEVGKKHLKVAGDYGVRSPIARLDPNQIRQVFLNLLRNSMEATSDGGEIQIKLLLEDRFIIFKVSDTGAGIPPENMDKVFDLFFSTKPKGTGLGLAICRKIVQDHGGEISISSEEGKGTTVTVKLPYRGVEEKQETETGAAYQARRVG